MEGWLEYNSDLFEGETIERMLGHYQVLLEGVVANPEGRISRLPLLTETERQQMLREWNATGSEYPQDKCIHQLFEEQVERTPEAVAVVFEDHRLTYRELNQKANQLGHYLRKLGVGPEVLVGICVERSLEMVIGLLGILKAGGAYVPLDPSYPKERLAFLMGDAQIPVLLVGQELAKDLPCLAPTIVCLDTNWDQIASESTVNLNAGVQSENLAYVIYTSGSTGRPKGVKITHQNVVRLFLATHSWFHFDHHDVWTLFHSYAFDFSVWEIWGPFLSGGRLVVVPFWVTRTPEAFYELLQQSQVTVLNQTPSAFRQLVEIVGQSADVLKPARLRTIILGGEALDFRSLTPWVERFGAESPQLVNMYGITETTVHVTYRPLMGDDCSINSGSLIGRQIPDLALYILDHQLQLVPVGVAGEIYVAGAGLCRGYHNRPDLTAEKFVPNPFDDQVGGRLYKTGDLARYLLNGDIEYLGRIDQQVKIRGYRIEPGEIEAALEEHPAVRQAVVLAREDRPGDKRLVAYVVRKPGQTATVNELRSDLKEKLPAYMVPSSFVFLDGLPLTPNGKVDRKALPAPELGRSGLERGFVVPRTPIEEVLASIWAEVLKRDSVGVQDNFFELGGHSLLATRVMSQVREAFQVEVPLRRMFEAQTLAGLAETIEVLRQDRQGGSAPPILPAPRQQALPLSFAQQRLWFLDQFEPGSCAYNMPFAIRLKGELKAAALEQSLREIIQRHEVLRTAFVTHNDEPIQIITPMTSFVLPVEDLTAVAEEQREAEVRKRAQAEALCPFDLATGPLMRARLVKLDADEHVLLLTLHHIASDGWSMGVLFRELSALYKAFSQGEASPLPPLKLQYADYAVWQRGWLRGEVLDSQLRYWKQQLEGAPQVLELPTDGRRPTVQTFRGERRSLTLSPELSEKLKKLSRAEGVTLFMTLLAAFQTLLYRYSGQEDLVVGTPIANRTRTEMEGLIGFFVNTLVLRTDLSGDPSFQELLRRVRSTCLDAYTHQDLPFEKLVEELQPERNLNRTPLFQVMLNLINVSDDSFELAGLGVEHIRRAEVIPKFDLELYVAPNEEGMRLNLVFNTDLFDTDRMDEMLEQFKHLVEQIVEAPQQSIRYYSLVTERSRKFLPDPSEVLPQPHMDTVTSEFLSWVKQSPQQMAVVQESRSWTYKELSASAHSLARALAVHGIKGGDVAAVAGPRSFGLIASVVGVFLSGGVLLTIDRNQPFHRQRLMMSEAGAKYLLYVGDWRQDDEWLRKLPGLTIIHVASQEGVPLSANDCRALEGITLPEVSSEDPAYIFFTSGTTGIPKGVLGCHKGLSHFLTWQKSMFDIGPADRCAQLTNLSFDPVLRDIFLPLVSGATLCLPNESVDPASDRVLAWLDRDGITLVHMVPTLAQAWLDHDLGQASLRCLRWVFFAGEGLGEGLVRRWRERFPQSGHIVNLYGPTETTLVKCFHMVPDEPTPGLQLVGRPLPQTQALVLNENGQACGIGEHGEIIIRTPFRTLGYINAPEEQRKRFVKNPFRDDPLDLVYYTGDGGRFRPDGTLEVLGRLDDQVKIRGVRIEPGEIMAVLGRHPCVKSCLVEGREEQHGEKILVAYVVSVPPNVLSASELRSHLSTYLPSYMVPGRYVFLESTPLTPNGKVDRKALQALDWESLEVGRSFMAPRTSVERVLAEIWTGVLKVEQVSVLDSFFDLGGHSLQATQMMSRIQEIFQVQFPLRRLFEAPTVAGLAEAIEVLRQGRQGTSVSPILPARREVPLPLSFAQRRLWFLDQFEPGSCAYNMPLAIRLKGELNVAALEQSLEEIVRRHEALRTRFFIVKDDPVQEIGPATAFRLLEEDLRVVAEEQREVEARKRAIDEAMCPFDLATGPMIRARLLKLKADEHVLLLTLHHIASDGWSRGVLFRELSALYKAFSQGEASPLPPLKVQYADYAVWQRGWLTGEVLNSQLRYWKQQLEGAPQVLELPTDRPRLPVMSHRGDSVRFQLPTVLSHQLRELSRAERVTLFMTLLAAFQVLLYRYTGQEDLAVATPIANRTRTEIEGLIGFFANTLVLRTDLSGHPSFQELSRRVRSTCLGAYAHQDIPFEKLVEELHPERNLNRTPLFQVMLALQNTPQEAIELAGLSSMMMEADTETAKFDLTLSLADREEGLVGLLQYNADLFELETVERLAVHYRQLLEAVVANREGQISRLPLLTETEQLQMLKEWNATGSEYPRDKCIHQLFEEQVERTPDAVAVIFEDHRLTYRELNQKANQLGHYFRKLGVGPEVLVGICVERSLEMVIGLLGILKAGGAYVPLDPAYPRERLAWMVEDAGVEVLLTEEQLLRNLPPVMARLVCLDRDWMKVARCPVTNPGISSLPDQLAYVIYTSGSTGRPKGVQITEQALVNILNAARQTIQVTDEDTLLAITTLSFDIATLELLLPLTVGARVIVISREVTIDGGQLVKRLTNSGATIVHGTPASWRLLLEAGWLGDKNLKILCGGETLPPDLANQLLARGGSVWNLYGPTETTIYSTAFQVKRPDEPILIGRPIANTRTYILDSDMQPVPMGVVGELYIGGVGVARGYWNRPELTAENFIPDPFSAEPGARLYRTGDLARYCPGGAIDFKRRRDHQVKLRGFRIELGEIEAQLEEHPAVRHTLVMAREDVPGQKRLVAYTVPKPGHSFTASELRRFLKQKLPDYMIPSAFLTLDNLPLTANGKLNRKALPAPDVERPELETSYVAPRTPVEELLAKIWSEVIGVERVGIHDNFFELGGHSLMAMKLSSMMTAATQHNISLRSLFQYPSIAALSDVMSSFPPLNGGSGTERDSLKQTADYPIVSAPSLLQSSSPHLKIERRSLLSLLGTGKIAPVDSIALRCLSDSILVHNGITKKEVINDWYEGIPTLNAISETSLGRIGMIALPWFQSDLYKDMGNLVDVIVEALELARRVGARTVSLTGLIPSATDYGHAVAKKVMQQRNLPKITTGHATIAATVVLSILRILEESGRDPRQERVGILGLGSIGRTALRLMLRCIPHPVQITLCDLYSQSTSLQLIEKELVDELGFRGSVRILAKRTQIPEEFYSSTLIVGTTNVPEVLDLELVRSGTLIVDDRRPQCLNAEDGLRRFMLQEDILFTEGDSLQSPEAVTQLRYLPRRAEKKAAKLFQEFYARYHPFRMTGCVLSSLLSARYTELEPTLGYTDDRAALRHYHKLLALGFRAFNLHCEGFELAQEGIRRFRHRFGHAHDEDHNGLKSLATSVEDR